MPKKNDFFSGGLRGLLERAAPRRGPALASAAAFAITAAVVLAAGGKKSFSLDEFETGKVADRDVIAEEPVSFIDEEATRLRAETQLRLVSAVFKYDIGINGDMRRAYDRFVLFSRNLFQEEVSRENYTLGVSAEFPGVFGEEALEALFLDSRREQSLEEGRSALEYFIEAGIFLLPGDPAGNPVSGPAGSPASGPAGGPDSGSILAPASGAAGDLSLYNPDTLELLHNYGERIERERKTYERIITRDRLNAYLARYIEEEKLPREFAPGAGNIVRAILRENVFFSPADTEQRLEEARSQLEPVYRSIERGSRVIRKGFIITAGEMEELRALNLSLERRDPRLAAGQILLLLALYLFFVLHLGRRTAGRSMRDAEYYLLIILAAAYLCGAALTNSFVKLGDHFPVAILLPTALAVMLPAILIGFPMALVSAMMLPLGAFLADSFNTSAYLFALFSGVAAAHVLRHAQKRMDLVRAGLLIAAANAGSALIILLLEQAAPGEYPPVIFWAAFNGLVSALLVIGILPVIEQALNAVTPFRLIELADLNSPILKRLFNAAPGTYSHSIMVANLAETACQEIGADALLARVGSYYHDIGKMEQPAYFVENQTSYNKHKDIAPRLSATVIRSHVKLGIEKARSLGLPEAIIAFIAEHHGNSVITWFYNEALKREGNVNAEDFTYPGAPPRSKESAVVMLADVTEAAARTLKKPTAARLEKYIQELFDAKVEHGQLAQSDLTFRELETIKRAFVKVLAGHYHSRIEYPKAPEPKQDGAKQEGIKQEGAKQDETKQEGTVSGEQG